MYVKYVYCMMYFYAEYYNKKKKKKLNEITIKNNELNQQNADFKDVTLY